MLVISIQSVFSFKSLELDCQAPAFDYSLIHSTLDPYCMAPYAHRGGGRPKWLIWAGFGWAQGGRPDHQPVTNKRTLQVWLPAGAGVCFPCPKCLVAFFFSCMHVYSFWNP